MYNEQEYGNNTGASGFMNSTSLVAKIGFLLLTIFIFIILLRLGISILVSTFNMFKSPVLIDGMVDAKQMIIIPQDPSVKDSRMILRSVNQDGGIEFTWSVWIMIDDLQYGAGTYKHIFHKGNDSIATNGLNFPNNGPGLYIAPNTNELVVIMNTFDVINEEITISDIPLNKWINVIIRCRNTTMDIYINGVVTKSVKLLGVPKQNYGDVYVAMNSGFSGYISNLSYYNYAISTSQIHDIMKIGPNVNMVASGGANPKDKNALNYLSLRWYFYGSQ
jgi:Concanavalin A-like lectin/glucanases superfamily